MILEKRRLIKTLLKKQAEILFGKITFLSLKIGPLEPMDKEHLSLGIIVILKLQVQQMDCQHTWALCLQQEQPRAMALHFLMAFST